VKCPVFVLWIWVVCIECVRQCFAVFSFSLFCSSAVVSTILSSSLLIRSSASDILVLIPSRVFLISVIILFVSVCLFFNSSRFLLIYSCISSILFSRFLIIFIIILNSFSRSLPISSSFIWTSVFLFVPSFVKYFFAFSLFFFLTYCVWGLLFPGFKGSWILPLKKVKFFLPFGFFPPKVGPVVCVSFL